MKTTKSGVLSIHKDKVDEGNRPQGNVMVNTSDWDSCVDIAWFIRNEIKPMADSGIMFVNTYGRHSTVYIKVKTNYTQDQVVQLLKTHLKNYCDWSGYVEAEE